ncbi:MAG: Iron-sulfur cluster insertion protein ErpA [Syntrophorhabdus sp. PtaB.Bin184]|jgi:iron-sulfur cluster assembly protein|nr:MAG: Iron-sulfur cluster insertion protein ErpA [Syntrophorhabdus sp. PtaB.Bin184]
MFEVSQEASDRIKQFLKEQENPRPIRILTTEGGWRGLYLVMAMDDQKEDDEVLTDRGVTFLVQKRLFERAKPIRIAYTHSTLGDGYILESQLLKGKEGLFAGCRNICDTCEEG